MSSPAFTFVPEASEPLKVDVNAVPEASSPKITTLSNTDVPVAAPSILILVLSVFGRLAVAFPDVLVWNIIVPPTPLPLEVAVDIVNKAALTLPPPPFNTVPLKAMSTLFVVLSSPKYNVPPPVPNIDTFPVVLF